MGASRCILRGLLAGLSALCVFASASAQAATVNFVGQFSPSSLPEGTTFTMNGDQVTGFSAELYPTACTSGSPENTESYFELQLPSYADVQLSGGQFSFTGAATSEYGAPYGGQFTVNGTVNPAHTVVTATVTLSGGTAPTLSGCSGTYNFIAIPNATPKLPRLDSEQYNSQFVSLDYSNGFVKGLAVVANFVCGTGQQQSVNSATFTGSAYGFPSIHAAANGSFSVQTYVLDEYQHIVNLTINGRVRGKKASGRIIVTEPAGGFEGVANQVCHGNYAWTATRATPPPPPGPTAYFQWNAIRVAAGTTYRYYFAISGLVCTNHASELITTVAGQRTTIPCSQHAAFASGPLAPSTTYQTKSQAVETKHGRIVKRGASSTVPVVMPGPGDNWRPISGLPGTPPS
jgi:hypothetical protein